MFRHFSFESAPRHLSSVCEAERATMNVSPCTSFPEHTLPVSTPPPCSMRDLALRFDQHNLHIEVDDRYLSCYEPLTPPSDDFTFEGELLDQPQQTALYPRLSAATLRKQRQANTRAQCSPTHLEDISALVQRMIEAGDQCRIAKPRTCSNASASDDEGRDMDLSSPAPREPRSKTLKFRRSGDRLNTGAAVSKDVRMRRKSGVNKRTS